MHVDSDVVMLIFNIYVTSQSASNDHSGIVSQCPIWNDRSVSGQSPDHDNVWPAEDETLQPVLRRARHPASVAAVGHHVAVLTDLQ